MTFFLISNLAKCRCEAYHENILNAVYYLNYFIYAYDLCRLYCSTQHGHSRLLNEGLRIDISISFRINTKYNIVIDQTRIYIDIVVAVLLVHFRKSTQPVWICCLLYNIQVSQFFISKFNLIINRLPHAAVDIFSPLWYNKTRKPIPGKKYR